MIADLLLTLITANLAGSLAILVVLAIRGRVRTLFGARLAYGLWAIPPAAMLAGLIPARIADRPSPPPTPQIDLFVPVTGAAAPVQTPVFTMPDLTGAGAALWVFGVIVFLAWLMLAQQRALARFGALESYCRDPLIARAANAGIGPALVGVIRPRVIVPSDFETRFDAREQAMILAHERTHLYQGHALINFAAAMLRAINWFNPLVHWAARFAHVDQELACEAAVVERFPGERRTYAETLLKTQLGTAPMPLGCFWPARSPNLLMERIEMLAQVRPTRLRHGAGPVTLTIAVLGAGVAWSAQAPRLAPPPAPTPPSIPATPVSPPAEVARPSPNAPATPAPELAVMPRRICLTNACDDVAATSSSPQALTDAIATGDSAKVIAAGGTASDVLAAWFATDGQSSNTPSINPLVQPGSPAQFVNTSRGLALAIEIPAGPGGRPGRLVQAQNGLSGVSPPPGTPNLADLPRPQPGSQ